VRKSVPSKQIVLAFRAIEATFSPFCAIEATVCAIEATARAIGPNYLVVCVIKQKIRNSVPAK
jgi:hypothetical protein